ncbi:site-2 protease family protein [Streptomyces sp. NPDC005438]|uniref:site-2 protease family protein n=1 Tax=Streptomyces sp. NPDC005438 TaxID=3156880 RepID=UPI0033B78EE1
MTATTTRSPQRVSPVFLGLVAAMVVSGWAVWHGFGDLTGLAVFAFVVSGWVVSLCLHEYAHARLALHYGDLGVAARGYLTLNPLRYTHPLLSIGLPLLFVVMGGIGLPGGAVFIERGRIRGRLRHSLISAAGPLTNLVFALLLTAPFWLGWVDADTPAAARCALAFLAMLQMTAALLNSLPVPGLDGYGVLEPWLSPSVRRQVEPFAPFGLLVVFACLWVPEINTVFWDLVDWLMDLLGVTGWETRYGLEYFRFWQGQPQNVILPG